MGATGWHYFVPYQSDMNKVLQVLRNDVFARKDYAPAITEEEGWQAMERLAAMSPNPERARSQMQALFDLAKRWEALEEEHGAARKKSKGEPKTIDELLEQRAEEGTGTILDIDHISKQPEFGTLYPLGPEQLQAFFGTERPTRAQVDQWRNRIPSLEEPELYERWEGFYFIVYANEQPDAIYIEGCSGD